MAFYRDCKWGPWLFKKNLIYLCIVGLMLLAFGLNIKAEQPVSPIYKRILKWSDEEAQTSNTAVTWQPKAGIKWQIQLENPVDDISMDADVFDIDLFDNTHATISRIHTKGAKVICYLSAGTYEDWRSDASKFSDSDFGNELEDWPGERWLDVHSNNVRQIMKSRLDMAQNKGCDGVDPDNIDAYGNDNGLGLTEADSINYLDFLSSEAHSRGMSVGLKNGGDIIASIIEKMQWSVNEQCAQYDECDVYAAFTDVNKPVFHIEYVGDIDVNMKIKTRVTNEEKSTVCNVKSADKFSTVIKNMDLDAWVQYC
ncbi:hypothetical protein N7448_002312 [Penicillium atrosanguineum]|uniref:alpha-galactosidase n=1 Tax=Penicillium atrosanguineum TaxID=1132637 RepID=A0A9W9PU27_9EURO|nr:uncharacterized protein N7443_005716 [Penicillium atrosanguineum]KAJ5128595.1 hypothetical protein N7526_006761 [Penicillium atrosanguineum]KAJ5144920.1 hypothetical protein N7448_002312 [Penicillium atrosanguineum]KAJ5300714.1 hypothetical protein N7443_005716 [Penicillium atrosanguineum]KAJ5311355.1 hypothetical protein N7476_007215 [Penicillium atrosanguineum]